MRQIKQRKIIEKNKLYWNKYYKKRIKFKESNFARFVWKFIRYNSIKNIADIGCGNGRDSLFFLKKGLNVSGYDNSKIVINNNIKEYGKNFFILDLCKKKINITKKFDVLYLRFFIHAISKKMQNNLLLNLKKISHKKSLFFFEYRTINDPLIKKGIKISAYERFTTHYRRFIKTNEFVSTLEEFNLKVIYKRTSNKFSITKNDTPEISRIIALNA
jgi:SAM-dependent methyltransferase